jgi:hypothetical protein
MEGSVKSNNSGGGKRHINQPRSVMSFILSYLIGPAVPFGLGVLFAASGSVYKAEESYSPVGGAVLLLIAMLVLLFSRINRAPERTLALLSDFAWLCSKPNREICQAIIADLKKDATAMRQEKCKEAFVQCVLLWHVLSTILPIVWDGVRRILAAICSVSKIINKIK